MIDKQLMSKTLEEFKLNFVQLYSNYIGDYDTELVVLDNVLYARYAQQPTLKVKLCDLSVE